MNNDLSKKLYYATWWRRFVAFCIDFGVLFPVIMLQVYVSQTSPKLYVALLIPFTSFYFGYWIFCHGYWGKTVGKRVMGTQVVTLDGNPISWRQAFLRNAVDIGLGAIACYALMPAYLSMPIDGYAELTNKARFELLRSAWPQWYPLFLNVENGWVWSEFIVILLNKRRRSLPDFIARTIVIQKKPTWQQTKAEDPYDIDLTKEMKNLQKL